MGYTKRQRHESIRSQLMNERSSFLPHWRDCADFILPRRVQFELTDSNRGDRRNSKLVDGTPTLAARTLKSGMMSGVTSPARPWKRLSTPDPDLAEFGPVKEWLHTVDQRMSTVFMRTNLYNALPTCYGDIGTFGTHAVIQEEDFDDVCRFYSQPIGSYCISLNSKLKVDTFYREIAMTVRQVVEKFGSRTKSGRADWSNISIHVKNQFDLGNYETVIPVCHFIAPNMDYEPGRKESWFKKYESCYYERGYSAGTNYLVADDKERYLSERGYDRFPVLVPRWEVTGHDVYGTNCPGMEALGDIKQLQFSERRLAKAVDKMVDPPMTAPASIARQRNSILPGDTTFLASPNERYMPAHEVNPRILDLENKQSQIRQRIQRYFYEDLFLMLASSDRREITAREIEERHEEKLLALGPVLEQLNQDLLDPLIDNTFAFMMNQGLIPEPPEELQGQQLKVEYISMMAQAQKLVGLSGMERHLGFISSVAAIAPESIDKTDFDQMIDEHAEMTSVPPRITRTDEKTLEIRQQRQQAMQAQQAAEAAKQLSGAVKDLGNTPMDGDTALRQLSDAANAGSLVPRIA